MDEQKPLENKQGEPGKKIQKKKKRIPVTIRNRRWILTITENFRKQ